MIKDLRFDIPVASLLIWVFGYARIKSRYMMKHPEKYTIQDRYDFGMEVIDKIRRRARTTTLVFGRENVPMDETVVFYANHQGKYDALGVLGAMENVPSSVLWEQKRADRILAREMSFLVNAVLIDLESMRGKAKGVIDAIELIKKGSNMLIFPEGKTDPEKGNALGEFMPGCFVCSLKTQTAIVPVTIYDSYKAMNGNNIFARVTTQVHFLPAIRYEEYKDMSKQQLCDLVKARISAKLDEIAAGVQ